MATRQTFLQKTHVKIFLDKFQEKSSLFAHQTLSLKDTNKKVERGVRINEIKHLNHNGSN